MEDRAEVKYSTVQNWYAGDAQGRGGVYNFVTKRGLCRGDYSKLSWTQVETGSAITWKYPSCILAGEGAVGEVLLRGRDKQLSAGRYRHKDGSHRLEYPFYHSFQRHLRRTQREQLPWSRKGGTRRQGVSETTPSATRYC